MRHCLPAQKLGSPTVRRVQTHRPTLYCHSFGACARAFPRLSPREHRQTATHVQQSPCHKRRGTLLVRAAKASGPSSLLDRLSPDKFLPIALLGGMVLG